MEKVQETQKLNEQQIKAPVKPDAPVEIKEPVKPESNNFNSDYCEAGEAPTFEFVTQANVEDMNSIIGASQDLLYGVASLNDTGADEEIVGKALGQVTQGVQLAILSIVNPYIEVYS